MNLDKKSILITGAGGFIGGYLTELIMTYFTNVEKLKTKKYDFGILFAR